MADLPQSVKDMIKRTGWVPRTPTPEALERAARVERAKRYGLVRRGSIGRRPGLFTRLKRWFRKD
jgi:hypothetical protein